MRHALRLRAGPVVLPSRLGRADNTFEKPYIGYEGVSAEVTAHIVVAWPLSA